MFQHVQCGDLRWSRDHPPSVGIALTVGCQGTIVPNKAIRCEQDGAIEIEQIPAGRKRAPCSCIKPNKPP